MLFWWICGGESVLPVLLLRHLGSSPPDWCFWTVALENTLESPLDCKKIQAVHPKGGQSWVFIERTDAKAETPILWPPDVKSWCIWKDPDAGKDWEQEEKGTTEDEMVGWHHWLNGHGFGWTPVVGDGQRGLACCSSWGPKESVTTERMNWTELNSISSRLYMVSSALHFFWVVLEFGSMWKIILDILSQQKPMSYSPCLPYTTRYGGFYFRLGQQRRDGRNLGVLVSVASGKLRMGVIIIL